MASTRKTFRASLPSVVSIIVCCCAGMPSRDFCIGLFREFIVLATTYSPEGLTPIPSRYLQNDPLEEEENLPARGHFQDPGQTYPKTRPAQTLQADQHLGPIASKACKLHRFPSPLERNIFGVSAILRIFLSTAIDSLPPAQGRGEIALGHNSNSAASSCILDKASCCKGVPKPGSPPTIWMCCHAIVEMAMLCLMGCYWGNLDADITRPQMPQNLEVLRGCMRHEHVVDTPSQ